MGTIVKHSSLLLYRSTFQLSEVKEELLTYIKAYYYCYYRHYYENFCVSLSE